MTDTPRTEHPRPDRRRDRWASLNGTWDFAFADAASAPASVVFDREITVPFAFQCAASGIGSAVAEPCVWYRRRVTPPVHRPGERVLLHVGAADFEATVWVDGTEVGTHRGGHTSFTLDVTDALAPDADGADEHELVVRVVDEFRADQLRGKQTASFPFMIHYTPTSGIWQPVWFEVTGPAWIDEVRVVAEADGRLSVTPTVRGGHDAVGAVRVKVSVGGAEVVHEHAGAVEAVLERIRPWSPDDPALYDLRVDLLGRDGGVLDTVHGHVGFRTITIEGDEWLLNGRPLRQRLLLDQGYWPESLITPPSEEAILTDLRLVKALGCNGVRKHQKIEDPRWLWHADRLGVLVWEELPSPFGIARFRGRLAEDAMAEWAEAIVRDGSHPCVVAWVPLNESWGVQGVHGSAEHQATVRRFVANTRALDPTRPVVDNSGWGHVDTDVVDVHDYDQDPDRLRTRWTGIASRGWDRGGLVVEDEVAGFDLRRWIEFALVPPDADPEELMQMLPDVRVWADGCAPAPGAEPPLVLSEFGGVGLARSDDLRDRFDYAGARDADDLLARVIDQIRAVEQVPELRGWCWTQLTDTEQEVNGLCWPDRTPKFDPAALRTALDALPWSTPGD